jgi:hypothetical protein
MVIRATRLEIRVRTLMLLAAGVPLFVAAAPLQSQVVTISPIANLSVPTKFSLKNGTLNVSQKVGFRFGARMTLTFSDRFDVNNAVVYSPGYATLHGAGKLIQLKGSSHSLAASTSARYWLRPQGGPFAWEVHTTMGMAFGGQPSYLSLLESSTVSAALGTAVTYQVGQLVSLTLKLQQRLLKLHLGEHETTGSSRSPFRVTFGVGLPILDRLKLSQ